MSRAFNGSSDFITFSVGAGANLAQGAITAAVLWHPDTSHRGGIVDGRDAGTARRFGVNPFDNGAGNVFFAVNGSTSTPYDTYIGQWAVLAFTKPAGAAQTVRAHTYEYDTATWTHADLGTVSANAQALTQFFVGSFDPGQFLDGNLAAIGLWTGTALADAAFEAGTGFQTTLANWFAQTPSVLWRFNQASTATAVTDLMGSGADQTAITGTSVSADDPPGFSYNLTSTISGTAVADLGALSAAASGSVTVEADALADLGSVNAAASGLVTVTGAALSDLGRLNATVETVLPDPDLFVSTLMNELLACLCREVALQPNPPMHCCFRVGTEIAHDAGMLQDQCCEGIAYVALGDTYPSSDSFPEQDTVRQASSHCAPPTWAQAFKVGIIRCAPVGNEFLPPSCTDWNAASRQNVIDAQTLRRVGCCMRDFVVNNSDQFFGMGFVIERQTQGNPQGGCVERSMMLTAQFPNCDCGGF